jgi:hypothetical protein
VGGKDLAEGLGGGGLGGGLGGGGGGGGGGLGGGGLGGGGGGGGGLGGGGLGGGGPGGGGLGGSHSSPVYGLVCPRMNQRLCFFLRVHNYFMKASEQQKRSLCFAVFGLAQLV